MYIRGPVGQYSFVDLQNPVIASSCKKKFKVKEKVQVKPIFFNRDRSVLSSNQNLMRHEQVHEHMLFILFKQYKCHFIQAIQSFPICVYNPHLKIDILKHPI